MNAIARELATERASTPPTSIDDLDAAICKLSRRIHSATYRLLLLVREFDDRLGWSKWSFSNCAEWLAWRCGISLSAAREKVRTAQALRDLPAISSAFEKGHLSYSKVRALTRAALEHDEHELLAYALNATAPQVEERCRQIRSVRRDSVHEARRTWHGRSLTVWRNPSRGTVSIHVEVPFEDGETITRALDLAIAEGEVAGGPEFPEASWRTQQADALVAVAKSYLAGGSPTSSAAGAGPESTETAGNKTATVTSTVTSPGTAASADRYQVVVHVDETALRGGAGRADSPIDVVKRLACDASLVVVTENERGDPLNIGRKQRVVPTALRRALWCRDRGCSFPGCHRSRFVDAHHVQHWSEGGETSLENLMLLCSFHHRLLHEGGYRIRRDADGDLYFQRSDGRVIPRGGYQIDHDDADVADASWTDDPVNPSVEGWRESSPLAANPSAEVREDRGVYRAQPMWYRGSAFAIPFGTQKEAPCNRNSLLA